MKILTISPNSPYLSVGGVERYIKNLIDFCQDQPDHYFFLLPTKDKDQIVRKKNVTIIFSKSLRLANDTRKGSSVLGSKRTVKEKSHQYFKFIQSFIRKHEIDAVVAQNFHLGLPPGYSLLTNMVCHAEKIPLFLQLHSFSAREIQTEIINGLFWEKIICVSKSVAGDTFQKGASIKSLSTKYLGVNTNEFSPDVDKKWLKKKLKLSQDHKVILCASRLLHGYKDILQEKGIINLLDAFSKIVHQDPSMRLVLAIGKPPSRLNSYFEDAMKKLEGYIQIHAVEEQVIVKTFKLEEMPKVYAGSDAFVLASENETFGQVYVEAMACGLPVIGTNVGGVPEIISDGYNGYLVPPNNSSLLAKRIKTLLDDEKIKSSFIENGLKTVGQKFTADKLFKKYFEFIRKIAEKK